MSIVTYRIRCFAYKRRHQGAAWPDISAEIAAWLGVSIPVEELEAAYEADKAKRQQRHRADRAKVSDGPTYRSSAWKGSAFKHAAPPDVLKQRRELSVARAEQDECSALMGDPPPRYRDIVRNATFGDGGPR